MGAQIGVPVTRDAVIVVPGIMGSELVDAASGKTMWGLRDPRWYVRAWTSGASLAALRLTDEERAGRYGRVKASQLLRYPAFAPVLKGTEPYTRLLDGIRRVVLHADAVIEFAYDWRLPVAHNATLLSKVAYRHIERWRAHPTQMAARRSDADDGEARLVIVAHSMGGLVARHLALIPGALDEVRATITLGTPFYGAVKAAVLLNSGRGAPLPLPRARLADLAAGLPGIYELLPTYRCVDTGSAARRLAPMDVEELGGDRELAEDAARWHTQVADVIPPGHVQIVGAHQPTLQSLTLVEGVARGHTYTCRAGRDGGIERVDLAGDGTVHRESAQLPGNPAMSLAQSHGAIAKTDEAILVVCDVLTHRRTGPWLGGGKIGLDVSDVVALGAEFEVAVTGVEHPRDASCRVVDAGSGRLVDAPALVVADGRIAARASVAEPGLYRVEAAGGGASVVSQLVLAVETTGGENFVRH